MSITLRQLVRLDDLLLVKINGLVVAEFNNKGALQQISKLANITLKLGMAVITAEFTK